MKKNTWLYGLMLLALAASIWFGLTHTVKDYDAWRARQRMPPGHPLFWMDNHNGKIEFRDGRGYRVIMTDNTGGQW